MTLTATEVASLTTAIDWWEYAEYSFTALVAIACFGEYIADFTEWWKGDTVWKWFGPIEHRKDQVTKFSTLVLIAALAGELLCVVVTNRLSGKLVGALGDRAEEAFTKSGDALNNGKTARLLADSAIRQSQISSEQSGSANKSASSALSVAREARKEADSFERDIASSRIALEKQNEEIRQQGPRWRMIEEAMPSIVEELKPFSGQQVSFVICVAEQIPPYMISDPEMYRVLSDLVTITRGAKWEVKTTKYQHGCLNGGPGAYTVFVSINANATKGALDAAKTLGGALGRLRPEFTHRTALIVADNPLLFAPGGGLAGAGLLDAELRISEPESVVIQLSRKQ